MQDSRDDILIVAFDVDGTLIDFEDQPRKQIVLLAYMLMEAGHEVIVWSGGGKEYAEMWAARLSLEGATCMSKFPASALPHVDIAFDDEMDTILADQMLIVGRH